MAKTTASLLPTIPRIFFLYLEPLIITLGLTMTYANRLPLLHHHHLSSSSSATTSADISALSAPAISCTYLLSMMLYGLMILLSSPPNARLLRLHIALLILADFTHWFAVASTIAEAHSWDHVLDTASWDSGTRTLMIAPCFTFAVKVATLLEWFGPIRDS